MHKYFRAFFQRVFTKAYFRPGAPFCWRRLTALVWIFALGILTPALPGGAETVPVTQTGYCAAPDDAQKVAVNGNYAYVADGVNGLKIIDISNPAAPVLTGACATGGRAYGIAVNGDYAYVACGVSGSTGLHIFDVSNPAAPTRTAYCSFSGDCRNVVLRENYAYVATGSSLVIVNVSNPSAPVIVSQWSYGVPVYDLALRGNVAYLVGGNMLLTVDIGNLSAPNLLTYLDYPGSQYFRGIALNGNYAYLADGNLDPAVMSGSMRIADISNPAAPFAAGYAYAPDPTFDVVIYGNYAFMAVQYKGLIIFDISRHDAMFIAGSFDTGGISFGVAVAGEYAYVADVFGLGIYHFVLPATPTPTVTSSPTCTPTPARAVPGRSLQVLVYPQPAQDQVYFRMGVGHDTEAKIVILNTAGDPVARIMGRISPAQPVLTWSAGDAGQGVYFYLVYLDGQLEAKGKLHIWR